MSDRILPPDKRFELVIHFDGTVARWDFARPGEPDQWTELLPKAPPPTIPWPPGPPPPPPPPPIRPAEPLHVRAAAFRRPDGSVWKYRGFTAFTALGDFIKGDTDKLERYVDYTRSKGASAWRIFCMWQNTLLTPRTPGYDAGVDGLTTWLNARGIWPDYVLFCDQVDGSPVLLSADDQQKHLEEMRDILRGRPVLVEEVNEGFKNQNWPIDRWGPDDFEGLLAARSSWQDDQFPGDSGSVLDWSTVHTPRDDEWPRKSKALVDVTRLGWEKDGQVFDGTHKPCIAGEPEKIDGQRPSDYAAYLALAELWGGGLIHGGFRTLTGVGTDLQNCIAPDEGSNEARVIDAVADVWAAGISPDAAGEWAYSRGPFDSCPLVHDDRWALRTFAMLGGDRAVVVVVRPNSQWRLLTQGGWQVERTVGPAFFCRR